MNIRRLPLLPVSGILLCLFYSFLPLPEDPLLTGEDDLNLLEKPENTTDHIFCTAFLDHIDAVDGTDCNADDGEIIVDPYVNGGTALPFDVEYTYQGEIYTAGPFNSAGDNYITGLAPGVYSNVTIIDANGCTADGGTLIINCDCSAQISHIDPVDATDCNLNDGQIIIDPYVDGGTALPFTVEYTYNGQVFSAGPFNSSGDNFISGLAAGLYTGITLIDANGCTADGGDLTIGCTNNSNTSVTVCSRVSTSADDAEEKATGYVKITSTDLELVQEDTRQTVGMRFLNLNIPPGAAISNASIQFTVDDNNDIDPGELIIYGEASDNAQPFEAKRNSLSLRPKTQASVKWKVPSWKIKGEAGADQRSVDISKVIEEIVNRPGYRSNSAIVIIITGTGRRTAESYDGQASAAPELCLTYDLGCPDTDSDGTCDGDDLCPGGLEPGMPCDDNDPSTVNDRITPNCDCTGILAVTTCAAVISSEDDAEESSSGKMNLTSSDLELVREKTDQIVGMRFLNLNIPAGATIVNANVQFTVEENSNIDPSQLEIYGEASVDPAAFSNVDYNLSGRPKTSNRVNWSPPNWNYKGQADAAQLTVDISPVIQEIVELQGYTGSSAIVLLIKGTGKRTAESFDGDPEAAPELCVSYIQTCPDLDGDGTCDGDDRCPDGPEPGTPCDDQDPGTFDDRIDPSCNCQGTPYECPLLQANIGDPCDDGDLDTSDDVVDANCNCVGQPNGNITVCTQIAMGSDDAEEAPGGSVDISSSDIELVFESSNAVDQIVGLRFANLNIPKNAAIIHASIQFTSEATIEIDPSSLDIYGEATADAVTFTNALADISSRPRTAATVNWLPPNWNNTGESGPAQQTPDLGAIVQEIVKGSGYTAASAIAFLIEGTGKRTAFAFEGDPARAARLCVTYGPPCTDSDGDGTCDEDDQCPNGAEPGEPCDDLDAGTFDDTIDPNCNCVGIPFDCPLLQANIGDACDDGDPDTENDLVDADCNCTGEATGNTTVCARIIAGSDDAEEKPSGSVSLTSGDLELVLESSDSTDQVVGLRFLNLNIPKNAVIANAYIQFTADATVDFDPIQLLITGEANGNPATFSTTAFNISSRSRTAASVSWSPPDWQSIGDAGPAQQTADISSVIQEIVKLPDYTAASSVVLIIEGTGKRTATSFNGDPGAAPELCVIYDDPCPDADNDGVCDEDDQCADSAEPGSPCDDLDPGTFNDTVDVNCLCVGTPYDCPVLQANFGDPCDDNDPGTINDTVDATCTCAGEPNGSNLICVRVQASSDDAEEKPSGSVSLTSGDLELVLESSDSTDQVVGLRFLNLNIPQGSTINSAYVQFTADATVDFDPCLLDITGEASDNAGSFTTAAFDISSRERTLATVSWSPPDWANIGDAGPAQQTVDLAPIIQEIVSREGYTQSSAIVIIIEGTGKRTAVSFNGDAATAPQLCVDYNEPAADPTFRAAEFIAFSARRSGLEVELNWVTNTEFKNDHFILQRSVDGQHFQDLMTIRSRWDIRQARSYQQIDPDPQYGDNYYRIKQVFKDGLYLYTDVRKIHLDIDPGLVHLFPNPARNQLSVSLAPYVGGGASLFIYDNLGRKVFEEEIDQIRKEPHVIRLEEYHNGLYHLVIKVEKRRLFSRRFVIERLY